MPSPRLGIAMLPVTKENCERFGQKVERGAFVEQVFLNTAAERCGLRPGDCIVSVGNLAVENPAHLAHIITTSAHGPTVITILRDGKTLQLNCLLPLPDTIPPDEQF
ncbi:MAG: PDZ domain-containing protein [Planctomycetota bacterium]|nr:PDZ domain-containing protein [Planctomycetota bacterium]